MFWSQHRKFSLHGRTSFLGVSIKGMAHILALKRIVRVAAVKYFQSKPCPTGAGLDKGVPGSRDMTHQKKRKEKRKKGKLVWGPAGTEVTQPPN